MFEAAELGQKVSKAEYRVRVPALRQALLSAQLDLRTAGFPVIVLFGGVDGAGKGDAVNSLNQWMDPRWLRTRAFDGRTQEEAERPEYWRFWRELPPKGSIGLLLSAWYSRPLLRRAGGGAPDEFEAALDEVGDFEKQLADDGALILKFWLHLGKKGQEKRFKQLERDPLQAWRVTELDWEHWRMYDRFVAAAERIITRTSTGDAPWHIIEGVCTRYASLRVGELLLAGVRRRLDEAARAGRTPAAPAGITLAAPAGRTPATPSDGASELCDVAASAVAQECCPPTVLSRLDTSVRLGKGEYRRLLATCQGRLSQLQRRMREQKTSAIVVFEGWDASGKGGTIRRINSALDARRVQVVSVGAPSDEERAHHYLWRFWRHVPGAGHMVLFDRSWYGRVLVERVEGFASEREWRRAYAEINRFEQQLADHGIALVKIWMHVTPEEQLHRFKDRQETPWKRWKLTEEDWRNRERWAEYQSAVHDMVERTSTAQAPWVLVEANDKPYARVKVLRSICDALAARVGEANPAEPPNGKRRKK